MEGRGKLLIAWWLSSHLFMATGHALDGPLGQLTGDPARTLGIEGAYSSVWSVVRWPIGLALVVGFLVCLYRFSANVRHCWRDCLPGAVAGAVLWISAAVAFRLTAGVRDCCGRTSPASRSCSVAS